MLKIADQSVDTKKIPLAEIGNDSGIEHGSPTVWRGVFAQIASHLHLGKTHRFALNERRVDCPLNDRDQQNRNRNQRQPGQREVRQRHPRHQSHQKNFRHPVPGGCSRFHRSHQNNKQSMQQNKKGKLRKCGGQPHHAMPASSRADIKQSHHADKKNQPEKKGGRNPV